MKRYFFSFLLIIFFVSCSENKKTIEISQNQNSKRNINFIILAGGKGSRMGGNIPKVLKKIGDKTILQRIIDICNGFKTDETKTILPIISQQMYDNFNELILPNPNTNYIIEKERKGTAGAVNLALEYIKQTQIENDVNISYILVGDAPAINIKVLEQMKGCLEKFDVCTLGFIDKSKNNFGKMILENFNENKNYKQGAIFKLKQIKEAKDYSDNEKQPIICNSGLHLHKTKILTKYIKNIQIWQKTGELNINDIIEIYSKNNINIGMVLVDKKDVFGANTPEEFKELEKIILSKDKK